MNTTPEIEKLKNKASKLFQSLLDTIKQEPKGFVFGLGVGVLFTGPFPGGLVIGLLGIGIIFGSMFVKK